MNYHYKENPLSGIADSSEFVEKGDEKVICRNCSASITDRSEMIEIDGGAFHYKRNPAGIYFSIICFRTAGGCRNIGDFTYEYSWFPGYKWCIVICAACSSHLGWQYSGRGSFYGLIADRIRGI